MTTPNTCQTCGKVHPDSMCPPPKITPSTCHLHFGPSPDGRYGKLIDPNGHAWIICSGCINSLWEDKQPFNREAITENTLTDQQIEQVVALLTKLGLVVPDEN